MILFTKSWEEESWDQGFGAGVFAFFLQGSNAPLVSKCKLPLSTRIWCPRTKHGLQMRASIDFLLWTTQDPVTFAISIAPFTLALHGCKLVRLDQTTLMCPVSYVVALCHISNLQTLAEPYNPILGEVSC